MELKEYVEYLKGFIRETLKSTNMKGFVLGVSGGIDSAVCAYLIAQAIGNDKVYGLVMPCHSNMKDMDDASLVINSLGIDSSIINLDSTFDEFKKELDSKIDITNMENYKMALANTKARLRMTTLYAVGQIKNYLVVGTDNLPETYTGYFTKHGDGAADIFPLRHLTKHEVWDVARILGVPSQIINKTPSAGLIEGITDEIEMGVSYNELDDYLTGKPINPEKIKVIENLHARSEHKRKPALEPKPIKR